MTMLTLHNYTQTEDIAQLTSLVSRTLTNIENESIDKDKFKYRTVWGTKNNHLELLNIIEKTLARNGYKNKDLLNTEVFNYIYNSILYNTYYNIETKSYIELNGYTNLLIDNPVIVLDYIVLSNMIQVGNILNKQMLELSKGVTGSKLVDIVYKDTNKEVILTTGQSGLKPKQIGLMYFVKEMYKELRNIFEEHQVFYTIDNMGTG